MTAVPLSEYPTAARASSYVSVLSLSREEREKGELTIAG
jgi:hypothetical protein